FNAVQELSELMKVDGHVHPAANTPLVLNAEFTAGSEISGEAEISAAGKTIKKVWVTTNGEGKPEAMPEVIDAIMNADQIVLGPASLSTSILPNFMLENVGRAVCESKAEFIYICIIITQLGEPEHFSDADHVEVLNRH